MIRDAHIQVGRYCHMTDAMTFDRSDFYYEPKVVADVLKRCGVNEFIFSSNSCKQHKGCSFFVTDAALMSAKFYSELVAAGVESQVLFGTDFPIQGGFYEWADADVVMVLECFYRDELSVICAARYSETVMSGNFRKFLNGGM